jgi:MFS family permease
MAAIIQACDVAVIRSIQGSTPCRPSLRPWVIAAASLGSGMAFLDTTVLNVALPAVQANLEAASAQAQWVYGAFALVLAALVLIGGSLGDRYGRRRVFVVGAAIAAAASVWCALAPGTGHLVAARAVQGAGAAGDRRGIFRGEAQGEGHRGLGGTQRHGDGGGAGLGWLAGQGSYHRRPSSSAPPDRLE